MSIDVKLTKKQQRKELVFRRPEGLKFDITPTDRVDDQTWAVLDSLCPNKKVLLNYSAGKDSTAAWLELRERGYTVVPIFKEAFPGISFYDSAIAAHEDFFGQEIHIIPHQSMLLERMNLFNSEVDLAALGQEFKDQVVCRRSSKTFQRRYSRELMDLLLDEHDCDVGIVGTKASDNLHRRTHFTVDGPYLPSDRLFSLVWRLKKNAPLKIMIDAGCPIPRYYLWLARSPEFLLEHEFYLIREYYPEDYARLASMLKNLDVYVKKYEASKSLKHVIKIPKIIVEAKERGHVFC